MSVEKNIENFLFRISLKSRKENLCPHRKILFNKKRDFRKI